MQRPGGANGQWDTLLKALEKETCGRRGATEIAGPQRNTFNVPPVPERPLRSAVSLQFHYDVPSCDPSGENRTLPNHLNSEGKHGAGGGNRSPDQRFAKHVRVNFLTC